MFMQICIILHVGLYVDDQKSHYGETLAEEKTKHYYTTLSRV